MVSAFCKHVAAFDVDIAFCFLAALFLFLVLYAQQYFDIDHLVEVSCDAIELTGHVVA